MQQVKINYNIDLTAKFVLDNRYLYEAYLEKDLKLKRMFLLTPYYANKIIYTTRDRLEVKHLYCKL